MIPQYNQSEAKSLYAVLASALLQTLQRCSADVAHLGRSRIACIRRPIGALVQRYDALRASLTRPEAQRGILLTPSDTMPAECSQTELKQAGDEAFKRGAFKEAVDAYGKALSVSSANTATAAASDPQARGALLANRCLALLKVGGQAHQALEDAQQACKLRPRWGKAHLRLGQVGCLWAQCRAWLPVGLCPL